MESNQSTHKFILVKHGEDPTVLTCTTHELLSLTPLSSYRPEPTRYLIENVDFGSSTHIVGPWYSEKAGNDFQLAVTGKAHHGETLQDAIARELGEELGMFPRGKGALKNEYTRKGRRRHTGWTCDAVNDMTLVNESDSHDVGVDDPDKKVLCIVHSSFDHMLDLCTDNEFRLLPNDDDIDGLVVIPIEVARELAQRRM